MTSNLISKLDQATHNCQCSSITTRRGRGAPLPGLHALAFVAAVCVGVEPVWAGSGGEEGHPPLVIIYGGAGGADSAGGSGGSNDTNVSSFGGSGGSATPTGPTGGSDGVRGISPFAEIGTGGLAGVPGALDGAPGGAAARFGFGGGGGAGATALTGAPLNNALVIRGGDGGTGGYGFFAAGGGGGGGYGALLDPATTSFLNMGTIAGGAGGAGGTASSQGGGGGGGGTAIYFAPAIGTSTITNNAQILGGRGGDGGEGTGDRNGTQPSGGGGGGGGNGVTLLGGAFVNTSSGSIIAGGGGAGGNNGTGDGGVSPGSGGTGAGGTGGSGGNAVNIGGSGISITNFGILAGGVGGNNGYAATGSVGTGGAGVAVDGDGNIVINGGSISGGLSGDGAMRADAVSITGNSNTLDLRGGYGFSGDAVAVGSGNVLALGGTDDDSFAATDIGTQYQGFDGFEKTGSSIWALTGSTSLVTPWIVRAGRLAISADGSLGDASGSLTIDGGTVQTTSSFSTNRTVVLAGAGGTLLQDDGTTLRLSGPITGPGNLAKSGAGTLVLNGTNAYTGSTSVLEGTLQTGAAGTLSAASATMVANGAVLDLAGFDQTLFSLTNAGEVRLGGAPGTVLTVDNYAGSGGSLVLNAYLGTDGSASDILVIDGGAATGTSSLVVRNTTGPGASTLANGILVVDMINGGTSESTAFTLAGDYVTKDGQQAVVGGAYAYTLHFGGVGGDAGDDNWYLRSEMISPSGLTASTPLGPRYQPGVPIYEVYPQNLLAFNGMPTMQQRIGNRRWQQTAPQEAFCKNSSDNFGCPGTSQQRQYYTDSKATTEGEGIWGRVEGSLEHVDPALSASGTGYETNVWKLQAGIDGVVRETEDGSKLIGGVTVHAVQASSDVNSSFGDGSINTKGYGFGSAMTWLDNSGFYVDGQAALSWFNSDLTSDTAGLSLISANAGFGYALSVETGKKIDLGAGWTVTPQAQLTYSDVGFAPFTDAFGATVSLDSANSLRGRLGFSVDRDQSWRNESGLTRRNNLYGIVNLYYDALDASNVDVSGVKFETRPQNISGGLGLGGSYNWNNDNYSVYGEAAVNTSLASFSKSYDMSATAGFRVKW